MSHTYSDLHCVKSAGCLSYFSEDKMKFCELRDVALSFIVTSVVIGLCLAFQDTSIECSANTRCILRPYCEYKGLGSLKWCDAKKSKVCCPLSALYDRPSNEFETFHHKIKTPVYDLKGRPSVPYSKFPPSPEPYDADKFFSKDYYEEGYSGPSLSREAKRILKSYEERECGVRRGAYGRISTGKEVDLGLTRYGEFPWQAAILLRMEKRYNYKVAYKYICGGTVISPKLLLTAAHCVKGMKLKNLKVKLGEWNLKGHQGEMFPSLERNIERVLIHDYYRSSTFSHDIAILVIARAVNLRRTPHISQICLPPRDVKFDEYSKCYIVGWGNDIYKPNYGSNILKFASVSFMKEDCKHKLKESIPSLSNNFLKEDISCVSGAYGKDACVGDGGGAVVCPISNREVPVCIRGYTCEEEHYFVAGVISWGSDECGQSDSITVVTDLASHYDWISDKIRKYGGSNKPFGGYGNVDHFDYHENLDVYDDIYDRDYGYIKTKPIERHRKDDSY